MANSAADALTVVIRTNGERTRELCEELVVAQRAVPHVLAEKPFLNAVKRTYAIGAASDAPYLLALDCDVLLYPGVLGYMVQVAREQMAEGVYRIDFSVDDKFRGVTCAGAHLYDNRLSGDMLKHIEATDQTAKALRPESDNVVSFCRERSLDYYCVRPERTVGLHDHGQYLAHLFAKYELRYHRCVVDGDLDRVRSHLSDMIAACPDDPDYPVALAGMDAGAKGSGDTESALGRLGIREKEPLGLAEKATLRALIDRQATL